MSRARELTSAGARVPGFFDADRPKYTPGPWLVGELYKGKICINTDRQWPGSIMLAKVHEGEGIGEQQANARLIAAAPELHDVLTALFEHCAMVHKHWGDGNNSQQADAAIEQGRALLARIGGQDA